MLKTVTLFITLLAVSLGGCTKKAEFPDIIPASELREEGGTGIESQFFKTYSLYIHGSDGAFSEIQGKAYVADDGGDDYRIAYYAPADDGSGGLKRLAAPVTLSDVEIPHSSTYLELDVPCIVGKHKEGDLSTYVFVYNGVVEVKTF